MRPRPRIYCSDSQKALMWERQSARQRRQALIHRDRQRRRADVEAETDCSGDLVEVLVARPVRPHGRDFDFGFVHPGSHVSRSRG